MGCKKNEIRVNELNEKKKWERWNGLKWVVKRVKREKKWSERS